MELSGGCGGREKGEQILIYEVEISVGRNVWVELERYAAFQEGYTGEVKRHYCLALALIRVGEALNSDLRHAAAASYRIWRCVDLNQSQERELVAVVAPNMAHITSYRMDAYSESFDNGAPRSTEKQ